MYTVNTIFPIPRSAGDPETTHFAKEDRKGVLPSAHRHKVNGQPHYSRPVDRDRKSTRPRPELSRRPRARYEIEVDSLLTAVHTA